MIRDTFPQAYADGAHRRFIPEMVSLALYVPEDDINLESVAEIRLYLSETAYAILDDGEPAWPMAQLVPAIMSAHDLSPIEAERTAWNYARKLALLLYATRRENTKEEHYGQG